MPKITIDPTPANLPNTGGATGENSATDYYGIAFLIVMAILGFGGIVFYILTVMRD